MPQNGDCMFMNPDARVKVDNKSMIEAALFVSGKALAIDELGVICNSGNLGGIRRDVQELIEEYEGRDSGIRICSTSGGYVMGARGDLEEKVMYLAPASDIPPAMLKILALIAYEQPIKQSDLVKERGNRVYNYLRELKAKDLIERKRSGRTFILETTPKFRRYFGIEDVKMLLEDGGSYSFNP